MDALRIVGKGCLRGEVPISGSKNASLPIMAAALLAEGESTVHNIPGLADVRTLARLLAHLGVDVNHGGDTMTLNARHLRGVEAPYNLVRTMRASFLVLGPLLARCRRARVSLPGGCAIGARPVDQHLKALTKLGVNVRIEHGYVEADVPHGLHGADVILDMPSVGATENLLLTASLCSDTTVVRNAAREPEVVDLSKVLTAMGAHIEGAGTPCIVIEGRPQLKPFAHRVIADRIEAGTFLVAGALVGDPIVVVGAVADHQAALLDKLAEAGAQIAVRGDDAIEIFRAAKVRPVSVKTAPYPGFPTDMQAQFMVLQSLAHGSSTSTETIFENRFMHVAEMNRLGADIHVEGGQAVVSGPAALSGSQVMATDLRASACLVLAGLVASDETVVRRIYHLDRGYEQLEAKLRNLGASIERFHE